MNPDIMKILKEIDALEVDPFDPELDVTVKMLVDEGTYDSIDTARRRLNAAVKQGKMNKRRGTNPVGIICDIYRAI